MKLANKKRFLGGFIVSELAVCWWVYYTKYCNFTSALHYWKYKRLLYTVTNLLHPKLHFHILFGKSLDHNPIQKQHCDITLIIYSFPDIVELTYINYINYILTLIIIYFKICCRFFLNLHFTPILYLIINFI